MIGKKVLNYQIEKLIGVGGMGSVYLASNENIDQKVAIKVLNENLSSSTIIRQKFKEEAKMLCSLDHSNIVKFLNFVENDEGIFLIMEYIDGITLEEFINKKNGLIIEERVYDLFDQILSAFSYAHKKGIVHRDIKPANILLTADNDGEFLVKVMDFGIARIISESNELEKNWIVGTPSYMSPEQVTGDEVDQRSDIYSLGVLLHEMLTGRTPYDATTLSELKIKDKVVKEPLPRMKDYYAYISEKMQRIVDKAVAKDRKRRFQNCPEFRSEMKKALRPDRISPKMKYSATAILFLLVVGAVWFWDYSRVKVSYYKDYVEQWGVPQGIYKLSSSEVSHREASYRFEYCKRKLTRMSHVNSLGKIIEHHDSEHTERANDLVLIYNENGKLDYVKYFDKSGNVLYKKDYNDKFNVAIFEYDDEFSTELNLASNTTELFKNPFDNNSSSTSKISRYLLTFNEKGYIKKIQYAGFQNVLVGDKNGIFGREYVLDDKDRIIEEHFLGYDGNAKSTKNGLGIKKYSFDKNDDWYKVAYFTIDNKPATDGNGCTTCQIEVDKYGNRIKETYSDSGGKLQLRSDMKIAGVAYSYNPKGQCTEERYLGLDKGHCFSNEGITGFKTMFDDNGFPSDRTFINLEGNPTFYKEGYASISFINDSRGNPLEIWTNDLKGMRCESINGFSGQIMKYDSKGNMIECIYYGADKKPILNSDGYAGYRSEYNGINKVNKTTYLDADLNPRKNSFGVIKNDYDKRGNEIKRSFYNAQGSSLVRTNENIAGWNSVYDENGNEIECSFFNDRNQPCQSTSGYARYVAKYDEKGNQTEIRYLGVNGLLCVTNEGFAGLHKKYDERGNILEKFPFGTDERLARNKLIARFKYDKFDNQIESSVYENDYPALNGEGYFKKESLYDNKNQELETRYYGKDNQLILLSGYKYAVVKNKYDEKGNVSETAYFDTNNNPCKGREGYSSRKNEYDGMNRIVRQLYFDVNGKPTDPKDMVPEGICRYDKWGNMIYIGAKDGRGNPINNTEGWAVMISTYNKSNKKTEDRYYDVHDVLRTNNFAIVRWNYDEMGRQTEVSYYDCKDKSCKGENGFSKAVYSSFEGDQALIAKIYNPNGEITGTFKRVNGEWKSMGQNLNEGDNAGWQSSLRADQKKCPQEYSEGRSITNIQVFTNSATITIKYSVLSVYNLSESDLEDYRKELNDLAKKLKALVRMPNDCKLTLIMVDKANREVIKTTC